MLMSRKHYAARKVVPSLLATVIALCLFATTSLTTFANTVRISDPVQVLNVSQVTTEGAKLPYALDIYTTSTYTGTSSDFVARTVSVHLTSPQLIVIAIDTTHRFLAIVGGKSVPLSNSQYNAAGSAFKNGVAGNHYTDATIAAIQSLKSSLTTSSTSSSKSSPVSGLAIGIIIAIIIGLIVIGAIFRFIRRLLGFAPPPQPVRQAPSTSYSDGRDNLGGGTTGNF